MKKIQSQWFFWRKSVENLFQIENMLFEYESFFTSEHNSVKHHGVNQYFVSNKIWKTNRPR